MMDEPFLIWYLGHVDSHGAVHGRAFMSNETDGGHTFVEVTSGKPWRWREAEGFYNFRPTHLEREDHEAIANWLIRQGVDPDHWSFNNLWEKPSE